MKQHCAHCGIELLPFNGMIYVHSDGYSACPPAFSTVATPEED